eukprot:12724039-Heterocapsa_arctica.AAC.1
MAIARTSGFENAPIQFDKLPVQKITKIPTFTRRLRTPGAPLSGPGPGPFSGPGLLGPGPGHLSVSYLDSQAHNLCKIIGVLRGTRRR